MRQFLFCLIFILPLGLCYSQGEVDGKLNGIQKPVENIPVDQIQFLKGVDSKELALEQGGLKLKIASNTPGGTNGFTIERDVPNLLVTLSNPMIYSVGNSLGKKEMEISVQAVDKSGNFLEPVILSSKQYVSSFLQNKLTIRMNPGSESIPVLIPGNVYELTVHVEVEEGSGEQIGSVEVSELASVQKINSKASQVDCKDQKVLFILDQSSSIDQGERKRMHAFVERTTKRIREIKPDASFGVISFDRDARWEKTFEQPEALQLEKIINKETEVRQSAWTNWSSAFGLAARSGVKAPTVVLITDGPPNGDLEKQMPIGESLNLASMQIQAMTSPLYIVDLNETQSPGLHKLSGLVSSTDHYMSSQDEEGKGIERIMEGLVCDEDIVLRIKEQDGRAVSLNWQSSQVYSHYQLLRSFSGGEWIEVESFTSFDNEYVDKLPQNGIYRYFVKGKKDSESWILSNETQASLASHAIASARVYPNPSDGSRIKIEFDVNVLGNLKSIQVFDAFGRMVIDKLNDPDPTGIKLDVLPPGTYFIQLDFEHGLIEKHKITLY